MISLKAARASSSGSLEVPDKKLSALEPYSRTTKMRIIEILMLGLAAANEKHGTEAVENAVRESLLRCNVYVREEDTELPKLDLSDRA